MEQLDTKHYVPILRWKEAERNALATLYEKDSRCLTPFFEIVPENIVKKGKLGKQDTMLDLEVATNRVIEQLVKCWGQRPFFIDLLWLATDTLKQKTGNFLEMLSQCANIYNLCFIPVTGLSRGDLYQSSVQKVLRLHQQGACLRLNLADLKNPELTKDINNTLRALRLSPDMIDILVDFRILDQNTYTFKTLCSRVPQIESWRNFIVASGAFPEDLSRCPKNDQSKLERSDWIYWKNQVKADEKLARIPNFSDYTIQHAKYIKKGKGWHFSASIRYTYDDYWLIMRGEDAIKKDGPGFDQWPANAILLCDSPEYCSESFSAGDRYIKEMSMQRKETGNPATWLEAGINHHMTFAVRQIANLF